MGRATVVSGGANGNYQVRLDYGKALRDGKVAKIDARVVALGPELTAAQAALTVHTASLVPLRVAVEDAIVAFEAASWAVPRVAATLAAALQQYTKAQTVLLEAQQRGAPLRLALDALKEEKAQLLRDRAYWAALVLEETVQAWCADLTEGATGAVATIEVPGENKLVLIAPAAPAPAAADGALMAREVASPEQCFFNAAILPGWQKHMPTYRRGTITAVSLASDKANVALDATDKSSAQGLNINQAETLTDVPVEYMTCNATAFEVGDRCVIKFKDQDWAQPRVVGFVDNPRPCAVVLSGAVKGGTVVTLPVPEGAPPGTAGVKVLRSYRPTANAWQFVLREDPTKSPGAFNDEPRLAKALTQYADVTPSQYSGLMAKAVQIVMGQGIAVTYGSTWERCHGVVMGGDGKPWLIEISAANGVLAMRLPLARAPLTTSVDAIAQSVAVFGGIPNGIAMPVGAALTAAITAGTVRRLLTAGAMAPVFGKNTYSLAMGWSFNDTGSEAHNTCWYVNGSGHIMGCHYKLDMSDSAASLSLVSEGRLVKRGPTEYPVDGAPSQFLNAEMVSPFRFDGGVTLMPRDAVSGTEITADINTTVFVCHIEGVLHRLKVQVQAYNEARDQFIKPHISTMVSDGISMSTGGANCYNDAPGFTRNFFTAVAYGACTPGVRDGYMLHEQLLLTYTGPSWYLPLGSLRPGMVHVALPGGVQTTNYDAVGDDLYAAFDGYILNAEVDRSFSARVSMFGSHPHQASRVTVNTAQYVDGIDQEELTGASLTGETTPAAAQYNFVGYL